MHDNLTIGFDSLTMDELSKIQSIVSGIISERKNDASGATAILTFRKEYLSVIENTFTSKYAISVRTSFQHLENYFGGEKQLKSLKTLDIEKFKIYIMQAAPAGYVVYLRTLKAAFNRAIDWELISENPFSKVETKKIQATRPEFITRSELQKIMDVTGNETIRNSFLFSFLTGTRLREVVNIKWKNIELEKRLISVGDKDLSTKNKKSRTIPIAAELANMLLQMQRSNTISGEYVFNKLNGFPFTGDYISKRFKKSVRKAGLNDRIHFHSLRHSFGSILGMKGVPITVIRDLMGHSSVAVTELYSHTNMDSLRSAIRVMNSPEKEVSNV